MYQREEVHDSNAEPDDNQILYIIVGDNIYTRETKKDAE